MRRINAYIKAESKIKKGRMRLCIIHSNRFVLHIILNKIAAILEDESLDFNDYLENILQTEINDVEKKLYDVIEKKYKSSLIHQVFRNFTKCRELQTMLNK